MRLVADEETLLISGLRRWPATSTVNGLLAAVPRKASLAQRLVAVRLLGELGTPPAIDGLVQLLADLDPVELQASSVRRAATRAWSTSLARGRRDLLDRLRFEAEHLPAALVPDLVQALAGLHSGETLDLLEDLQGLGTESDACILDALAAIPAWDQRALSGEAARLVREQLTAGEVELRRRAVLAASRMRDPQALETLVQLLEDPDPRVRHAAAEGLGELTGARPGEGPAHWQAWIEAEFEWIDERYPELLEAALGAEPALAVEALRELSMHPLQREGLAYDLEPALERREAAVVVAAAGALARLQAGHGVRPLIELLVDERPGVREAAHAALRATTGTDLPADAEAWDAWLEPAD